MCGPASPHLKRGGTTRRGGPLQVAKASSGSWRLGWILLEECSPCGSGWGDGLGEET